MREIKGESPIIPEEINIADDESCCPIWSGPVSGSSAEPVQIDDYDDD